MEIETNLIRLDQSRCFEYPKVRMNCVLFHCFLTSKETAVSMAGQPRLVFGHPLGIHMHGNLYAYSEKADFKRFYLKVISFAVHKFNFNSISICAFNALGILLSSYLIPSYYERF